MDRKQATQNAKDSFTLWHGQVLLVPYDLEFKVYGTDTAGTCDFVGGLYYPKKKIFGRIYYLDWKTGTYIDRASHGPQIASYKHFDGRYPDAGIGVVNFSKDEVKFIFTDYTKYEDRMLGEFFLMHKLYMSRHPQIAKRARG